MAKVAGLVLVVLTVLSAALWASLALASCGGEGRGTLSSDARAPSVPEAAVPPPAYSSGSPVRGVRAAVGSDGGVVSRLHFAVVGDTRPAALDDVEGYPTAVISRIYRSMGSVTPPPTFAIATGDYQFASATSSTAFAQVALYLEARALFPGPVFPAMGNHECTGATASNCGDGNPDGTTNPLRAFEQGLLAPIGKTRPYYEVDVSAEDGAWTAKFLILAANAWSDAQARWLDAAMSRPTTYTFVVRHEPASATAAPGVAPSEGVMALHPYTLAICGHKHTYEHPRAREVVVGNGGAPLTGSGDYGFAIVSQQDDGSLSVDMIDYATGRADPGFHFTLAP
jgi:hypothetical protein